MHLLLFVCRDWNTLFWFEVVCQLRSGQCDCNACGRDVSAVVKSCKCYASSAASNCCAAALSLACVERLVSGVACAGRRPPALMQIRAQPYAIIHFISHRQALCINVTADHVRVAIEVLPAEQLVLVHEYNTRIDYATKTSFQVVVRTQRFIIERV